MLPTVLTIGGSDSSGGAGLSQDQRALLALNVIQRPVVSLVSAQTHEQTLCVEAVSIQAFRAQLHGAFKGMPPDAIKLGALHNDDQAEALLDMLRCYPSVPVVWDPVLRTSSDGTLGTLSCDVIAHLLASVTLVTPNRDELAALTGFHINHVGDEIAAAHQLLALGCRFVLVTGGCAGNDPRFENRLYSHEHTLSIVPTTQYDWQLRGSGCLLASAIAACLALQHDMADAVCRSEAVVASAFSVAHELTPTRRALVQLPPLPASSHYPIVYHGFSGPLPTKPFPPLRVPRPGLYPVVDSIDWLRRLLPLGSRIIQLRIKQPNADLSLQIQQAAALAAEFDTQLFINDHWQLAIEHGAYGVHLGQEDLAHADLEAISQAGLRLGVSTHGYAELCRVLPLKPSYIALGHIFPTTTKKMISKPQGVARLTAYRTLCGDIPTVAIGGIGLRNIDAVAATGVSAVAVVTAITQSDDPAKAVSLLQRSLANA